VGARAARRAWGFEAMAFWRQIGWTGVDLFFALSGFLVGGLLFAEFRQSGQLRITRFYIRRGFKIWPSYLLFLAVVTFIPYSVLQLPRPRTWLVWPNWLHLQNYFGSMHQHTWSLAVEEHFYLLLPLLLLGMAWWARNDPLRSFRAMPFAFIGIAAMCLFLRLASVDDATRLGNRLDVLELLAPTHLRIDSLFAGVALAYFVHLKPHLIEPLRRWRHVLLVAGIACFTPPAYYPIERSRFMCTTGLLVLSIGSVMLTLWAWFASTMRPSDDGSVRPIRGNIVARLLALIGMYSYSIFLWHVPFAQKWSSNLCTWFISVRHPRYHIVLDLVYVGIALVMGITLYMIVEKPALAIRNRLFPSALSRPAPRGQSRPRVVVETTALGNHASSG
jgi:peptidoglycan/LPS O-acetylase OafA/YrhL